MVKINKHVIFTWINSFNPAYNASKTSGINSLIADFETLYKYCRDVYESPVARNLNAISNLILGVNASLIAVSCFEIWSLTCKIT